MRWETKKTTIAVVSLMVKKLPVVKREKTAEKQMGCRRLDQERVLFSWDRSNCHGYRYAVQKALKGKQRGSKCFSPAFANSGKWR